MFVLQLGWSLWTVAKWVGQTVQWRIYIESSDPAHRGWLLSCKSGWQWLSKRIVSLSYRWLHAVVKEAKDI